MKLKTLLAVSVAAALAAPLAVHAGGDKAAKEDSAATGASASGAATTPKNAEGMDKKDRKNRSASSAQDRTPPQTGGPAVPSSGAAAGATSNSDAAPARDEKTPPQTGGPTIQK
jgi:hypothetical protein